MCSRPCTNLRSLASIFWMRAVALDAVVPFGVTSRAKYGDPLYLLHFKPSMFPSSSPRKTSCGTVCVELYSDIKSSSVLVKGSSPMNDFTSL